MDSTKISDEIYTNDITKEFERRFDLNSQLREKETQIQKHGLNIMAFVAFCIAVSYFPIGGSWGILCLIGFPICFPYYNFLIYFLFGGLIFYITLALPFIAIFCLIASFYSFKYFLFKFKDDIIGLDAAVKEYFSLWRKSKKEGTEYEKIEEIKEINKTELMDENVNQGELTKEEINTLNNF